MMNSQDSSAKRAYRKPMERDPNPKNISITSRDMEILKWLHKVRMLNMNQIQSMFFATKDSPKSGRGAARVRMRKLWDHQLVTKLQKQIVFYSGELPYVYALDKLGAERVAVTLEKSLSDILWEPHHNNIKGLHISHYEDTNDLWIVLHKLNKRRLFELQTWYTDLELRSEEFKSHLPRKPHTSAPNRKHPDGFFTCKLFHVNTPYSFFVEVDRGTEDNQILENKFDVYHAYRLSEASEEFYGSTNWRLLVITTSSERKKNLIKRAIKKGCKGFCWFTTQEHIDIWNPERFLDPIWEVAGREGLFSVFK